MFLFFLPNIASASNSVGTITIILGKVDVLKPSTDRAVPAYAGHRLEVGDVVRTKRESKAEINFNDGSIIRLAQNTRFAIIDYALKDGKREKSSLKLFRGKIRAIVSGNSASKKSANFKIHTLTATAGVRGTDFYVYYIGSSGILVTEGTVAVFNPAVGSEVLVTAGYATNVGQGKPPEPPRPTTQPEIDRHNNDTDPGFEEGFNNSGVSIISELVGELEPVERHLYVYQLLAQNDPPPSDPPPSDPPPSDPPPSDPPPVEPPPVEPPPVEPPPTGMPFPPSPPAPDNGNEIPPPPWTPHGPPGNQSPGGISTLSDPPPVPTPGNSGLTFPPPAAAPVNSPNTPPPWTPEGPPGKSRPG